MNNPLCQKWNSNTSHELLNVRAYAVRVTLIRIIHAQSGTAQVFLWAVKALDRYIICLVKITSRLCFIRCDNNFFYR